jgi:hypothetical protein
MYEQRDDRENQQQVNQETGDVENHKSADPQDEQQYRDPEKRSESHRSPRALASSAASYILERSRESISVLHVAYIRIRSISAGKKPEKSRVQIQVVMQPAMASEAHWGTYRAGRELSAR